MPGVNPLTVATDRGVGRDVLATTLATYPHVAAEPPLACYVTASCPAAPAAGAESQAAGALRTSAPKKKKKQKCKKGHRRRHGRCVKRKRSG